MGGFSSTDQLIVDDKSGREPALFRYQSEDLTDWSPKIVSSAAA